MYNFFVKNDSQYSYYLGEINVLRKCLAHYLLQVIYLKYTIAQLRLIYNSLFVITDKIVPLSR